ncbi:MAG: hypothetical protein BBJ60_09530 [Desulfobacterales bacterium S7086C20]|nr:MAG: hypothetical protein BBJ60_09530 [Desulfobacterales bacterium S7086C20]
MEQLDDFLSPTPAVDSDNESIRAKAEEVTKGLEKAPDKARSLFYWVRDEIKYEPLVAIEVLEGYRASRTLGRGKGFCVEKAALLAAFARVVEIPSRLHLADIRNYLIPEKLVKVMDTNLFACHGYSELYINGKWVKATPAFDQAMCQEKRIRPVEFDAEEDAIFHSHNLDGELHIEYVKDRGCYADVPMDHILDTWLEVYGAESIERLNKYMEEEKAGEGERGSQ